MKLVDRSDLRWGLPVCLIVAIALRGAVIWMHADELSHERDAYLGIARGISQGKGYVDVDRLTPTAFRPPLYPLQLGAMMLVVPESAAVAIVNMFWGAVGVWATWQAGAWLGLNRGRFLAALLVAVDPMLLLYSAQPMTEVTCAGLVALLLYWIVRRDCAVSLRQFGIGLLFGCLVLCRPTFWPMAGLAMLMLLIKELAEKWGGLLGFQSLTTSETRNRTILSMLNAIAPWRVVVGTLLIVSPWVVRNQIVIGSPIVMTTHGGYTLLLANNPVFYTDVVDRGWGSDWAKPSFDGWQEELQTEMANQLGPTASELDRDCWQSLRAREFIAAKPSRFMKAAWFRVRSLWSTSPRGEAASGQDSRLIQLVSWYYTVVLLASVVGMLIVACRCFARPRRLVSVDAVDQDSLAQMSPQPRWWPLFVLVLTVQLVHLVYWTNARMRAPIVPVISLFAAAGMGALSKRT